MKLLFDRQLAPSLVRRLADVFPGSVHVDEVELSRADDWAIWDYAKIHGLMIVSKDKDFEVLSVFRGQPPKVVMLRIGNCTVQVSADLLRKHSASIYTFAADERKSLLIIAK